MKKHKKPVLKRKTTTKKATAKRTSARKTTKPSTAKRTPARKTTKKATAKRTPAQTTFYTATVHTQYGNFAECKNGDLRKVNANTINQVKKYKNKTNAEKRAKEVAKALRKQYNDNAIANVQKYSTKK